MDKSGMSGIVKKPPAGGESACRNLSGKGAGAALSADLSRKGAPKAGSEAPSLGMNTNGISHAGEPNPPGQRLGGKS